jgi:hypothetical protein
LTYFKRYGNLEAHLAMTPEILAKIMGIVAKGKERVIVVDPASGAPFALLNLEEYSALVDKGSPASEKAVPEPQLTGASGPGILDPDLALLQEAKRGAVGDWGGDEEEAEEDRYYMEPTE